MKKIILFTILSLVTIPFPAWTQTEPIETETFEAKIIEIIEEKEIQRENGTQTTQQNILLKGLNGTFEDKELTYYGISDIDVLSMTDNVFKKGDRVLINSSKDTDGNDQFFIMNYVRRGYLYVLALIFSIAIIAVGRKKGIRSLISLTITFFIIAKFIIPQIISGSNPLLTALIGSVAILGLIVYITEGFNKKTHIAILSILISLLITFLLSYVFVNLAKLTGFSSEEASFLASMPQVNIIDFRGLLLAAIMIGTLGVLDDVILGQIEAVNQIKKISPDLSKKKMVKSASEIGRTHLGSMVNTLFLTYAGASLPLLILFSANANTGVNLMNVLDNEFLATEIVRTLTGSIGLILAFPITTYLAVYFLKKDKKYEIQ
ncbi:YibE/F [Candidatus Parcubacteria bacterium]|nr:MAG: YibE/F [Candidatus Parcubacteria bacterium]